MESLDWRDNRVEYESCRTAFQTDDPGLKNLIMKSATRLVLKCEEEHPLGKSIHQKKVPILTSQLRQRLEMSEAELDFTPASLERLEDKLFELLQKIDIQTLTDEDIVQFVREISAYFGKVLVVHAERNWEPLGTLLGTLIVFKGIVKVIKEGRRRIVSSLCFSLANEGAVAIDMASMGKKPLLYRNYLSARAKIFREDLG